VFAASQLGQTLFVPPNVRGWPGGEAWINSSTLLARKAFLERLFRADELAPMMAAGMGGSTGSGMNEGMEQPRGIARVDEGRNRFIRAMMDIRFDSGRWLAQFEGAGPAGVQRVLLAAAPVQALPAGLQGMELIRHLTLDPVYQLK
jgi:hypothetical protein